MIALTLGMAIVFSLLRALGTDTLLMRCWCLIWGASAAGAILLETRPWWQVSWSALAIIGFTICLGLGASLAGGRPSRSATGTQVDTRWRGQFSAHLHGLLALACLPPAYVSVYLLLRDLGQGFEVFSSLENLVTAAAAASIARYHDDFDAAAITRALTTFIYLSGFIAGSYARRSTTPWSRLLLLASVLPPLGWTVLLTTKANLLLWLCYAIAGFLAFGDLAGRTSRRGWKPLVWGGAVVALAILMFGVQLARGGADSFTDIQPVAQGLTAAALGHVFAFRHWLDDSVNWLPQTAGERNFAGIFELLGVAHRELGIYGEENVEVGGSSTNVYSALRGLIEDVGVPLSFLWFLLLGWSGALFERRASALARGLLAAEVAWIFWSPVASIFSYNSLLFACILFAAIIFVSVKLFRADRA